MSERAAGTKGSSAKNSRRPAPAPAESSLVAESEAGQATGALRLQSAVGNKAVTDSVRRGLPSRVQDALSTTGDPLSDEVRARFETHFDADLAEVRIHTDSAAAAAAESVNARAFTVGRDVFFGHGRHRPDSPSGRTLLAHEVAHVLQQQRGGQGPPAPAAAAAHEMNAERAAASVTRGVGSAAVQGGTGVGMARSIDEWLSSTPDIRNESIWSYSALLNEADVIHQWLQNQTTTTPESGLLESALQQLKAEVARRDERLAPQAKGKNSKSGRKGRGKKKNRKGTTESDSLAAPDSETMEKPRVLREQTSVEYSDDGEIRRQVDLIMHWLKRDDVSPEDREVLEAEVQVLRPALTGSRVEKAEERRQARIVQALQPQTSGEGKPALVAALRRIGEIRPHPDLPGSSYIMHGDEMIVLRNEEVAALKAHVVSVMNASYKKVAGLNTDAFQTWAGQAEVNRENVFAAWGVSVFGGDSTKDPFDRMYRHNATAANHLSTYGARRRNGDLEGMAEALTQAADEASKSYRISADWADNIQVTGSNVITGLTITRDLSAAIVTSYAGGAGFLALKGSMGVVKAAGVVTVAGATSNAVFRGGTNAAGQALSGGDVNMGEVWTETKDGLKQGAVNSLSGIATAGTANFLGQGKTFAGTAGRNSAAGFSGGATAGATNAVLEGKSAKDVVLDTGKGGFQGALGGVFGGGTQKFGGAGAKATAARVVVGGGGSATAGFVGELAMGGSVDDAKNAAIREGVAGALMASPAGKGRATRKSRPPPGQKGGPTSTAKGPGSVPAVEVDVASGLGGSKKAAGKASPPPAQKPVVPPKKGSRVWVHEVGWVEASNPPVTRVRRQPGSTTSAEPHPRAKSPSSDGAASPSPKAPTDRSGEVAEVFGEAQRIPGAERGPGGKRVHDEAHNERMRRDQEDPSKGDVSKAGIRDSHDLGVEGGRRLAREEGVFEQDWSWNPKELKGDFGKGPDGIARDRKGKGSYGFVEWKGGKNARLEADQGSAAWSGRKIAQMEAGNDPMAAKLLRSARRGNLKTWVYKTKAYDPVTGKFDTSRIATMDHQAATVLKAYKGERARLRRALKAGSLKDLGEL